MGYFDDNPITKSPYSGDVDLLWHPDYKKKKILLDFTSTADGCIKAGTPISAAGAAVNDNAAVGILLHDCYDGFQPYGSVVIDGFVKENVAQEHSGVELCDEAKRAMSKIVFVDASGVVDPPAGGGWPQNLPLPSEGGYGYTEGDGTTITWDGDTSGRVSADIFYKVADEITVSQIVGAKVVLTAGTQSLDYTITQADYDYMASHSMITDGAIAVSCDFMGAGVYAAVMAVVKEDGAILGDFQFPETGLYFANIDGGYYVASLSYGNETVHKIDEKYLPASGGGALVVHMTGDGVFNQETYVITVENGTLDHTAQEIYDAGNAVIVYDYVNEAVSPNITTRFVAPVLYFQTGTIDPGDGELVDMVGLYAFTTITDTYSDTRGVSKILVQEIGENQNAQGYFSYILS